MTADDLTGSTRFVSRTNRALAVVVWVVCTAIAGSVLVTPVGTIWFTLLPVAFAAIFAWQGLWLPELRFDGSRIVVRNVLATVVIPWNRLVAVETRFALTLLTAERRISVWVAPAPGSRATYRAIRGDQRGVSVGDDGQRSGDLIGSESGDAAYLVRTRWERLRALRGATTDDVELEWHAFGNAALAGLALATLIATVLTTA